MDNKYNKNNKNNKNNIKNINKLFIEDTNKLILKNEKINIINNESILKNKFWMNVYDKMKTIIHNYPYQNNQNNIIYKKEELHDGHSILKSVFKDSAFISQTVINYIKLHLTHYYLIEFDNNII